jgi:hypothetical protein
LPFSRMLQVGALTVLVAALALAVTDVVDDWSDWVVFGGIVVAAFGTMVAVNRRQYPTAKRSVTRDADSNW